MKKRDVLLEELSDVKNVGTEEFYAGQFVPPDFAMFYPGGMMP